MAQLNTPPPAQEHAVPIAPSKTIGEEPEKRALDLYRQATFILFENFALGSPVVMEKIRAAIRLDPRTEELKSVKARLDAIENGEREELEVNKRILQDVEDIKRKIKELESSKGGLDEPSAKRIAVIEARVKANESRAGGLEDRVKVLELQK